jgi:hypothetical protein
VTEDADIVLELAAAIEARDWDRVERSSIRTSSGETRAGVVRGRTNVLRHLTGSESIAAPASWELRDGQVYRWNAGW